MNKKEPCKYCNKKFKPDEIASHISDCICYQRFELLNDQEPLHLKAFKFWQMFHKRKDILKNRKLDEYTFVRCKTFKVFCKFAYSTNGYEFIDEYMQDIITYNIPQKKWLTEYDKKLFEYLMREDVSFAITRSLKYLEANPKIHEEIKYGNPNVLPVLVQVGRISPICFFMLNEFKEAYKNMDMDLKQKLEKYHNETYWNSKLRSYKK